MTVWHAGQSIFDKFNDELRDVSGGTIHDCSPKKLRPRGLLEMEKKKYLGRSWVRSAELPQVLW